MASGSSALPSRKERYFQYNRQAVTEICTLNLKLEQNLYLNG